MAPSVQAYFNQGLAQSTQKTYSTAMRHFHEFCARFNITTPFPITEHTMCCFAAYLADRTLSPQTVKGYLAAVRNMQLSLGLPDPRDHSSLPRLKRVLAGISRVRLSQQHCPRVRLPITGSLLTRIHTALVQSTNPDRTLIWAISSLAFFGFFRLGELLVESADQYQQASCLSWGDVAVDSISTPSMVRVHLRRSKCDQFGKGVDVIVGRTGSPICPVTAVLEYIRVRQDEPGPFFINRKKEPATKPWLVQQVRRILQTLGLPQDNYAGHSFRIGAATSAALAGIEDSTIQALGRWQSAAFLQYIRLPREQLAHISTILSAAALDCPGSQPTPCSHVTSLGH